MARKKNILVELLSTLCLPPYSELLWGSGELEEKIENFYKEKKMKVLQNLIVISSYKIIKIVTANFY